MRWTAIVLCLLLLLAVALAATAQMGMGKGHMGGHGSMMRGSPPITVMMDDKDQHYDTPPMMLNGRVMVPMRGIFDSLGANVRWDPDKHEAWAMREGKRISLMLGSREAMVDGKRMMLDAEPRLYKNRMYVPLRFVGESMGAHVQWRHDQRQVRITRPGHMRPVSMTDGSAMKGGAHMTDGAGMMDKK